MLDRVSSVLFPNYGALDRLMGPDDDFSVLWGTWPCCFQLQAQTVRCQYIYVYVFIMNLNWSLGIFSILVKEVMHYKWLIFNLVLAQLTTSNFLYRFSSRTIVTVYIIYNISPRTVPCGAPASIGVSAAINTNCFTLSLLNRYCSNTNKFLKCIILYYMSFLEFGLRYHVFHQNWTGVLISIAKRRWLSVKFFAKSSQSSASAALDSWVGLRISKADVLVVTWVPRTLSIDFGKRLWSAFLCSLTETIIFAIHSF